MSHDDYGRARRPKARRSSGSAIVAEVFMNNAGYGKLFPVTGLAAGIQAGHRTEMPG